MNLDIRSLRLIVAIADTGGVTSAAKRLYLTQSALSHRLRNIEKRLGVALFLRVNRRLVMTEAGERLLATARKVLAELDVVERELSTGDYEAGRGRIRLVTECYTCYHWLPPVMAGVRRRWPKVDLEIVPDATSAPLGALRAGAVDVAIVHRHEEAGGIRYVPLFEDELMAIMAPGHELAGREYVAPEDFASQQLLIYATANGESTLQREVLRPHGIEPRSITRLQLTEAIVELVKAGMGIAALARWAVAPHVAAGQLVAIPITSRGLRRHWSAALLADAPSTPYLEDFVAMLSRDVFSGPVAPRLTRMA